MHRVSRGDECPQALLRHQESPGADASDRGCGEHGYEANGMSAIDFKTVVPAAQAGDKAAQNLLMEKFYAWSVTVARNVVRDSEIAKDVAVDFWTWMFTGKGILEYDSAKGAFYSWMEMRLKYRALDAMKKQQPKLAY